MKRSVILPALDLRARVIRAAEAFILGGQASRPASWDEWFVIETTDARGWEHDPDLIFPRSSPGAFPDFARNWLRSTPRI